MTEKKPIADKPEPGLEFAEDADGVCRVNNKNLTVINTIAGGFNNIKLVTYANEGPIPHFHFYRGFAPENDVPVHTPGGGCICFETLNYYHHGSHIDSLTKEESADMTSFLKQKNLTNPNLTNWEVLINDWNACNYMENYGSECGIDHFVSEDLEIPDYTSDMGVIKGETTFINTETGEAFTEYADAEDIVKDAGAAYHEMAFPGGFDDIRIAVSKEDCRIPYFRFYKGIRSTNRGVPHIDRHKGGCICITGANYFSHGTHTDTMSCEEIEGLIEFLKKPHWCSTKITNWERIIALWNDINWDQTQVPQDLKIPNYTADMPNYTKDFKNTGDIVSRK